MFEFTSFRCSKHCTPITVRQHNLWPSLETKTQWQGRLVVHMRSAICRRELTFHDTQNDSLFLSSRSHLVLSHVAGKKDNLWTICGLPKYPGHHTECQHHCFRQFSPSVTTVDQDPAFVYSMSVHPHIHKKDKHTNGKGTVAGLRNTHRQIPALALGKALRTVEVWDGASSSAGGRRR